MLRDLLQDVCFFAPAAAKEYEDGIPDRCGRAGKSFEHRAVSFVRSESRCHADGQRVLGQGKESTGGGAITGLELGSVDSVRDREDAVGLEAEAAQFVALRLGHGVDRAASAVKAASLAEALRREFPRSEQAVLAMQQRREAAADRRQRSVDQRPEIVRVDDARLVT